MANVTARYTSPTHSFNVAHPVESPNTSQKASLEALRQAILSTQNDLNVFLTERKLEEDRANCVKGPPLKRKNREDEDGVENEDEDNEEEE